MVAAAKPGATVNVLLVDSATIAASIPVADLDRPVALHPGDASVSSALEVFGSQMVLLVSWPGGLGAPGDTADPAAGPSSERTSGP